jgi:hypothetical protein
MRKVFLFLAVVVISLYITVAAFATTVPTLNIQGTHGNFVWRSEYAPPVVSISIETTEDERGKSADWWLLCLTPTGWKHYIATGWVDGVATTYTGGLFSFAMPIATTGLDFTQPGTFMFFWGIDRTMDGNITSSNLVYDSLSVSVIPTGKKTVINLFDSFQVVGFDTTAGNVEGFIVDGVVRPIAFSEIESVMEVSDRVGWIGNSVAISAFSSSVWIPNTANNDKAMWALSLFGGKTAWLNLDQVEFVGKTIVRTADDLIQYGNYAKQSISFANKQAYIAFACNLTDGFVAHVNPSDIEKIKWNQDGTNWDQLGAWGTLQVDVSGNYFVSITNSSVVGSGLFSAVLKNGTTVWINKDSWNYNGAKIVGERIVIN